MDGLLNLYKPRGMSSLQAVGVVKRKLSLNKVGHLGTLDPAACGVLVLMCGRATKLANQLHAPRKVYRTLITWGRETDTLDDDGQVVATSTVIPTPEQIRMMLPNLVGEIEITVPKYSAVHIHGQRAYDLARNGIEFTPPTRIVRIDRFEMLDHQICENDLAQLGENFALPEHANYFEIECETGTYVRSLVAKLAHALGTVATASVIIRTRVGDFALTDSKSLAAVQIGDIQMVEV